MKKILFLLQIILLCAVFANAADVTQQKPNSSKECAVCHYEWMPEFLFELQGTEIVDYQKEKVVAKEKMCFSCHNGTVGDSRIKIWTGDSHKLSNKIPEHMTIPKELPLDNGAINCRTCHSAHSTGNPEEEGVEKSVFLRMKNDDSQLCQACHSDFGKKGHNTHPMVTPKKHADIIEKKLKELDGKLGSKKQIVCESCHTPHSPKEQKLLIYYLTDSKLCSTCHDDKVNADNSLYLKGMLNHPINITHEDGGEIVKAVQDGAIYGPNNEVICLTCHSPHKGETESLLIKENKDSELCLDCHKKKSTVIDSKHDMHLVKGFVTKDGKTAQQKGTCESCHKPHGWSLNLPSYGQDMISKACISCHSENGYAPKKVISENLFNHPVSKSLKDDMLKSENLPLFGNITKFLTEIFTGEETKSMVTCATCHDVHAKDENFLRVEAKSGALCTTCHKDKEMIEKTVHGREKLDKSCLSCHKVHNSENKRLLIKTEKDGCIDCHKKGGSAEKSLIGEHSHPVDFKLEKPLNEKFKATEDNRFTCTSCHDPHKPSKTEKLKKDFLRGEFADSDSFCSACHEDQKAVIASDHDVRKTETEQVCAQCHSVHKAQTENNIMAIEYSYKDMDDSCRVCHNENGSAKKKVVMEGGHKLGKVESHEKYGKYLTEKDGDYYIYCSSCHTVHSNGPKKGEEGTINNSFLSKKLSENGNICAGCHEDKKSFEKSSHNVVKYEKSMPEYEALKAQNDTCGACHQVHNSGYFLFDKSLGDDFEKICTSCHSKDGVAEKTKISTSHKMGVKLDKELNIFLQNGKVVCATCHEPHGTEKGMLRKTEDKNICTACHKDQKLVELSEHNLARIDYLSAEAKKEAENNVCYACHQPHNFHKENSLMWAFEQNKKVPFAFEMCSDCHNADGVGYKKIPEAVTHDRIFKIFPYKERFKEYLHDDSGEISADGSITCQTCHNPHIWKKDMTAPETGVEGDLKNSFLKSGVKTDFCEACHGKEKAAPLFDKYHDREFRENRNKKIGEAEVMRNIMMLQMNLQEKK